MNSLTVCLSLALVGAVVASHPGLVTPNRGDNGKLGIFGGKTTTIKKHPYVASLVLQGYHYCAASIINKKWLVTLATCVSGLPTSALTVVVGSNDGTTGTKFSTKKIVTHPSFKVLDYDLALVEIKGSLTFSKKVKAVNLPSKEVADNTKLMVAGYGLTGNGTGSANTHIQQGQMFWLPYATCNATYSTTGFRITPRMACAQNKGKTSQCLGDWGNALVTDNTIYGIYSASLTKGFCTKDAEPDLFTDIFVLADWIKENTAL